MMNARWRPLLLSAVAVALIWVCAIAGYRMASGWRMTAEKVNELVKSTDLARLQGAERSKAIKELIRRLNALSPEERQKVRIERTAWSWFMAMTDDEKGTFVEETMPTGFKQMLTAFEQLPEDKRKRAVDDALRRLRESATREPMERGDVSTNAPPLSKELEAKIRTIGLKAFYSQSSAQTRAELAPVLEELQRVMESGRPFRRQ